MSQIITCLKLLASQPNILNLAQGCQVSWLQLLELIAKINQIEPGLVKYTRGGTSFRLSRDLTWLDEKQIVQNMAEHKYGHYQIKIVPETNSTNTYVLNNLQLLSDNTVIVAELQLNGRGRNDKIWHSLVATDLMLSILRFFADDFNYEILPLVVAIGINRLLKEIGIRNFIKWPNDILLKDNSKIAGVLLESGNLSGKRFVVIGVGLNNPGTIDRNLLLCSLIRHIDRVLNEYTVFGFSLLRQEWLDNCIHLNKPVQLYFGDKLVGSGTHAGLTEHGGLIIKSDMGEQQQYTGGASTSLRFITV